MGVRTTVVGSWYWPAEHQSELRRLHDGELAEAAGRRLLDACATAAIAEQRELGLDEWSGGEYFTDDFINHLRHRLSGIEFTESGAEEVFDYDDLPVGHIIGRIRAPGGLGYLDAYRHESRLPGGVRKASVVSPLEVMVHESHDQDRLREQLPNVTEIVNRELRGLSDAGCPHVQLDAPVIGQLVSTGQMTAAQAADLLAPCFEGVTAIKGLHICNGNLRGRPIASVLRNAPWVEIAQHLEGVIDVAAFECSYFSEWLERESFRALPQSISLAAGIVDEANYWVEPVSKIRSRAQDWARVVGEERLWISPSCGLGRHPGRDRPVLRQKIENMVAAAQLV